MNPQLMQQLSAYQQAQQQAVQNSMPKFQVTGAGPNDWPGLMAGPRAVGGYLGRQLGNAAGAAIGGAAGGVGRAMIDGTNQGYNNPLIRQGLQAVHGFLSAIGHPMAQPFGQMHGFGPASFQPNTSVVPGGKPGYVAPPGK